MLLKIFLLMLVAAVQQEPLGEYWGTGEEESKYYRLVDIPLPEELAVEAGSFEVMPDQKRLAVATRRGDIFMVEGAFDRYPEPKFKKFASGLDEVFGMAYRDGSFLVTQQTEVTRITDSNQDGRADQFETLSDVWGFRHYHEFAFGSKPDPEGNIWVALCLSKSYHSDAPFRGWCLKVTPDGKTIPVCSGIRSPCGIGPNEHGVMFYSESQGPWNGSCSLKVLQPGGFMGHPISFNWYDLAPNLEKPKVVPNTPSRLEIERKRVKELVPYAVVFPYKRMGRSISGYMVDRTGGKFGPFENQMFVADFSLGVIMRATTEKINGVWQGACYPFREGFETGLLAVQFTPQGQLIAGGTNRGWPVRGRKAYAVQRLDWTGLVPFEMKTIKAKPEGFEIEFTKPVDPAIATNPENYELKTFTHIYRQGYGSPEVDQTTPRAVAADVSEDGLRVMLKVEGRVQGHVHDFYLPKIRSADGESLLHSSAYYTLNEIPKADATPVTKPSQPAPKPKKVDRSPEVSTRGVIPIDRPFDRPVDADVLVSDTVNRMIPEGKVHAPWVYADGVLTASPKWDNVVSPKAYRDFWLHLEFNVNDAGDVDHEKNGNSGVYLQQRYEIQILNSYGISMEDYGKNDCGCIYRFKKPDQLANRPAGQWQSFDIAFRAARFRDGQKIDNARVTVYQNDVLIHDDVELRHKTGVGKREERSARPILLQGHHNEVKFRNVWIQPLKLDSAQQAGDQDKPDETKPIPQITVSQKKLPALSVRGEVFRLDEHDAFLIMPKGLGRAKEIPWVWYAPTLPGLPDKHEIWMIEKFLAAGVAVAGIDAGESYGSPKGNQIFTSFYDYLTESRNLSAKPCLLARSRGGLMLYSWAAEHPESVSGIAGVYPVCNLASYPGLKRAAGAFDMTAEALEQGLKKFNPIDRLEPLAKQNVPIFHIHGDVDKLVPSKDNSEIVAERYRQLGGTMTLKVAEGQGHNVWPGFFQCQELVDFTLKCLDRLPAEPDQTE